MTVTMTGTVRSRAVPGGGPSKSKIDDALVSIADTTSALNTTTLSLVTGKAAVRPTLYSDLVGPVVVDVSGNFQVFNVRQLDTGGSTIQIQDPPDLSSYTIGDHLWLCLFGVAAPAGAAPIAASIDLGLLLA